MRVHIRLIILVAFLTSFEFGLFYVLGMGRIDPVIFGAPASQGVVESEPRFSVAGSAAWFLITAIYTCGLLLGGQFVYRTRLSGERALFLSATLLALNVAMILIFHPTLLRVLLSPRWGGLYFEFIRGHIQFLRDIYENWAIRQLAPFILLLQVSLSSLFLFSVLGKRGPS